MEKETIEANDLKFRQKVEDLRAQLEGRQQTYAQKRKASFQLTLTVLSAVVVLTTVGLYFVGNMAFRDSIVAPVVPEKHATVAPSPQVPTSAKPLATQPRTRRQESVGGLRAASPRPAAESTNEPLARRSPRAPVQETVKGESPTTSPALPAASLPEVPRTAEVPAPTVEVVQTPPRVEPPVATPPTPPSLATNPTPSTLVPASVANPPPSTTPLPNPDTAVVASVEPTPPTPVPPVADINIAQSLVCLGVEARECVGAQTTFALHAHNVPHVWMTVYSEALPYVLKHVYYHEGQRYVEVPLAITYPRMRTWSRVTLTSPTHVGAWRVEIITEDGTVVKQVEFRVTP